jgi:triacylglycerol lipase
MGGFEQFWFVEYWGGTEALLREEGFAAYSAVVDPVNGSDLRAQQLSKFVDRVLECTCSDKVNIIGHSQGGIDARVLVDVMGYNDRVDSVTTMSTPHRGSPVPDRLLDLVPGQWDPVLDLLVYLVSEIYTDPLEQVEVRSALTWCSTDFMETFNEEHPPHPDVSWYSYAGRAGIVANGKPECENAMLPNPTIKNALNAPFYPGWTLIGGLVGVDNDGLVPVESAKFGDFLGCVPADHVQEIGMYWGTLPLFDHTSFYLDHAVHLENWGH